MGDYRQAAILMCGEPESIRRATVHADEMFADLGASLRAIPSALGELLHLTIIRPSLKVGSPRYDEERQKRGEFLARVMDDGAVDNDHIEWCEVEYGEGGQAEVLACPETHRTVGLICRVCDRRRAERRGLDICQPCWVRCPWARNGDSYAEQRSIE